MELGGFFVGFGLFDLLDEDFLGLGFREGDFHLLLTVGTCECLGVFDFFLLDDDCFFHGDTFFDDVLDFFFLDFDGFVFLNVLELGDAGAFDGLELLVAFDALKLDGIGALFVALGDEDLALFVFLRDLDFFFGGDACLLGFLAFFFLDFQGLCLLAGLDGLDFSVSASWRSSSRMASRASTSCCLMTFSLSRWMLLESLAWVAVRSWIFLMPSASRIWRHRRERIR